MTTEEVTRLAHVVATIDTEDADGKILYVNPSNINSSNADQAARLAAGGNVELVLRDADGGELGRVYPEVRYDACSGQDDVRPGLIQHDIDVPENLAIVELVRDGEVLDTFRPEAPEVEPDMTAGLTLAAPLTGLDSNRSRFGAADVGHREGVTYLIQVKPDNALSWSTLSIGRKTPEFEIDKNQFPGARYLTVRVIRNAGFTRKVMDEREIPLE